MSTGSSDGLAVLRALKFEPFGRPLEPRDLNQIEQINQTWTYLVSFRALTFLFERHPEAGGFKLSLGTRSGTDIMSLAPHAVAVSLDPTEHLQSRRFCLLRPSNFGRTDKTTRGIAMRGINLTR